MSNTKVDSSDNKQSHKNHHHKKTDHSDNESVSSRINLGDDNSNDDKHKATNDKTNHKSSSDDHSLLEELKIAKQTIEQLKNEYAEEKNKLLLAIAERENLVRRVENEKKDSISFANQSILKSLVEPMEQLFLALMQKPSDEDKQEYKNMYLGVEMTKNEFIKSLAKFGLNRVFPVNEVFNPSFHQAISVIEDESLKSGTVKTVVQAGYELNGRLIKPALVIVVK
jgi:molecular chaperone GrpE